MATTVYFATNRVLRGPADQLSRYGDSVVGPANPNAVTYGTAFVNRANPSVRMDIANRMG